MLFELGLVTPHKRKRLPHWDAEHAIYFVTWRLADALPRAALWLCVPALLAEGAAGVSQVSRTFIHSTNTPAGAIAGSAASVALLFGMLAVLSTPVAAALVLVVSLLHRWRLRVVALLWLAVVLAMALMLPAMDRATGTLMLLLRTGSGP